MNVQNIIASIQTSKLHPIITQLSQGFKGSLCAVCCLTRHRILKRLCALSITGWLCLTGSFKKYPYIIKVKVKQSCYRPGVVQRVPDFMTTVQDGGKAVSLTHRPPLPPENAPGTHFCQRLSRPQGHSAIRRILCQ